MTILPLLTNITREVVSIANELIPMIDKAPIEDYANLKSLVHKCLSLFDRLTYSDDISLNELAQNNYEFLDTMKAILVRFSNYKNNSANSERLVTLIFRIDSLLESLNSPPILLHREQTLKDSTEPYFDTSDDSYHEPSNRRKVTRTLKRLC